MATQRGGTHGVPYVCAYEVLRDVSIGLSFTDNSSATPTAAREIALTDSFPTAGGLSQ